MFFIFTSTLLSLIVLVTQYPPVEAGARWKTHMLRLNCMPVTNKYIPDKSITDRHHSTPWENYLSKCMEICKRKTLLSTHFNNPNKNVTGKCLGKYFKTQLIHLIHIQGHCVWFKEANKPCAHSNFAKYLDNIKWQI